MDKDQGIAISLKVILRACLFAVTVFAIFLGIGSYGKYVNEELGEAFLVLGAFVTAGIVTGILAWFLGWIFADDKKPAENESPTTADENQDATT